MCPGIYERGIFNVPSSSIVPFLKNNIDMCVCVYVIHICAHFLTDFYVWDFNIKVIYYMYICNMLQLFPSLILVTSPPYCLLNLQHN